MRRTIAVGVVLLCCVSCFAGVGAAAHEEADRNILAFELAADGDAVVHHVESFELNETRQRQRYESFADNETRRSAHREDVLAELRGAAADGRNATELEMRVGNATVRTYEQDGYGRVAVRAEWSNLGFYNDERVVVTEPFQSGYVPNLSDIGIHGPEGYERGTMLPTPIRAQANSGLWNPTTSNTSNFYAEFVNPEAVGEGGNGGGSTDGDGNGGGADGGENDGVLGNDGVGVFLRALALALVPIAIVLFARRQE